MSDISEGEMVDEGMVFHPEALTQEQTEMIASGRGEEVAQQMKGQSSEKESGGEQQKIRIGVVGDNAVAQAMQLAFDVKAVETMHVSGLEGLDDLIDWKPGITFLCTPVPLLKNDSVDDAELINMTNKLIRGCGSGVCIKSSINIETIERLIKALSYDVMLKKVTYNPVMGDDTDIGNILSPQVEYFGGDPAVIPEHMKIIQHTSVFSAQQVVTGSIFEVAYAKLAVAGFKAVKQTYFNQLHDAIMDTGGANPSIVRRMIEKAPELTDRSVMIPTFIRGRTDAGISYKQARSFGGEFENDVRMFASTSDKLPLLDECINYKNLKD
jgi:hypothetical protein